MVEVLRDEQLLRHAARNGDVAEVQRLMAEGTNIDAVGGVLVGGSAGYYVYGSSVLHATCGGHHAILEVLLAAGADVNMGSDLAVPGSSSPLLVASGSNPLCVAASRACHECTTLLLSAPRIHLSVDAGAERQMGKCVLIQDEQLAACMTLVQRSFARWRLAQAVCAAAADSRANWGTAGCGIESLVPPPVLVAALAAAREGGVSAGALSAARAEDGLTALGGAAFAGACLGAVNALLAAGVSLLVAGDLDGASAAERASRAGYGEQLVHRLTGPRALLKATALAHPVLRQVRSMLVVGNRVGLPPELVDHILEFCCCYRAGDACWFAAAAAAAEKGGGGE